MLVLWPPPVAILPEPTDVLDLDPAHCSLSGDDRAAAVMDLHVGFGRSHRPASVRHAAQGPKPACTVGLIHIVALVTLFANQNGALHELVPRLGTAGKPAAVVPRQGEHAIEVVLIELVPTTCRVPCEDTPDIPGHQRGGSGRRGKVQNAEEGHEIRHVCIMLDVADDAAADIGRFTRRRLANKARHGRRCTDAVGLTPAVHLGVRRRHEGLPLGAYVAVGVVEMICRVAKGVHLKLGEQILGQLLEKPVDGQAAQDAALRMENKDHPRVSGVVQRLLDGVVRHANIGCSIGKVTLHQRFDNVEENTRAGPSQ